VSRGELEGRPAALGGVGNSDRLLTVPAPRQVATGLVVLDVALFLAASAFNDHSTTSVDGILWWLAIFVFALLILVGLTVFVQFLRARRRRPRRSRVRSR
jgi:ABC-type nickel/cobalt efflux system permease component RcnA